MFIPSLKFGIEYDGIYYHQGKEDKIADTQKEKNLADQGIELLRIKEIKEKKVKWYQNDNIIYCNRNLSAIQLNEVIGTCFDYISKNITHESYDIDIDVKRDSIKINELFIVSKK